MEAWADPWEGSLHLIWLAATPLGRWDLHRTLKKIENGVLPAPLMDSKAVVTVAQMDMDRSLTVRSSSLMGRLRSISNAVRLPEAAAKS